jgi:hypothetical protein
MEVVEWDLARSPLPTPAQVAAALPRRHRPTSPQRRPAPLTQSPPDAVCSRHRLLDDRRGTTPRGKARLYGTPLRDNAAATGCRRETTPRRRRSPAGRPTSSTRDPIDFFIFCLGTGLFCSFLFRTGLLFSILSKDLAVKIPSLNSNNLPNNISS